MVRRSWRVGIVVGLIFAAFVGQVTVLFAQGEPTQEELWGPMMEQSRTLLYPNQTHTENRGLFLPYDSEYNCIAGDIVSYSEKKIVGQISTTSDHSNGKYTAKDIEENPDLRYCTTVPFWLLGVNSLLLQEKNPSLLLDVLKINGQRFQKGATSYQMWQSTQTASNADDLGPTHYLPGIFPLELTLTYQQVPTDRRVVTMTLGELQDLMSHFPYSVSVEDIAEIVDGLGVAMGPERTRDTIVTDTNGAIVKAIQEAVRQSADVAKKAQGQAYHTNVYRHPLPDRLISLLNSVYTTVDFWKDGIASAITNEHGGIAQPTITSPVMTIAHDQVGYRIGADGALIDGVERMHTYLDDSLLLQPMFRLFSDSMERQIRPAADFFCKSSFEGPSRDVPIVNGKVQLDDAELPFVDNMWKTACATLSGQQIDKQTTFGMLAPYVDQTFNTFATINGNQRHYTNYLRPRNLLAEQSVANKNTAHMDWFGAAAHCMARGGRLPQTDELLYMAVDAGKNPTTSRFFQDFPHNNTAGSSMNYVGSFVYSGDFVKATNAHDGQKGPYVTALYLPPVGNARSPIAYNPAGGYEYFQCADNGDQTIQNIAGGASLGVSPYIDWTEARLCRVSLHTRPALASNAFADGGSSYLLAQVTDPAPHSDEVEYLPTGYRGGTNVENGRYFSLSAASRSPSTHVICVYD